MHNLPDDTQWAVTAFAEAALGDARRTTRLGELARVLAQHPSAALPEACGSGAMLKGAYRFFSNDALEPQDVLARHIEATYGRLAQVPLVLAVQDTTAVDWTAHPATTGLGPLGHPACQGLRVHSPLACTPERGPWGLLAQQVEARDPDDVGQRGRRTQRPIAQKESQKGLTSLEAVVSAQAACPPTRLVSVGDRAADVDALLAAPRPEGVERWWRASWDRRVQGPERSVWATVEAQPVREQRRLPVPRRGAHPAREATLERRFGRLTLRPPRHRKQAEGLPEVTLWGVHVRAVEPPTEVTPLEWLLLTTVAVHTVEDARERVAWYAGRWGIEGWQRMGKSGWQLEERQLATDTRLQRCLTLYSVLAWRVFYAIMLARAVPELPCAVLLEIEEWQALDGAIHHCPTPPAEPPALGEAVRWMAQLGGFVGRRRCDPPGAETLWRGLQHRSDLTRMYGIMRPAPP